MNAGGYCHRRKSEGLRDLSDREIFYEAQREYLSVEGREFLYVCQKSACVELFFKGRGFGMYGNKAMVHERIKRHLFTPISYLVL